MPAGKGGLCTAILTLLMWSFQCATISLSTPVQWSAREQLVCTIPYTDEEEKPLHFPVWFPGPDAEGEPANAPTILLVDPRGRHAYVKCMRSSRTISIDMKRKRPVASFSVSSFDAIIDAEGNLWFDVRRTQDSSYLDENTGTFRTYSTTKIKISALDPFGRPLNELIQRNGWGEEVEIDSRYENYPLGSFVGLTSVAGTQYLLYLLRHYDGRTSLFNLKTKEEIIDLGKFFWGTVQIFQDLVYVVHSMQFWDKERPLTEKRFFGDDQKVTRKLPNYGGYRIEVYSLRERKRVREYTLPASGQLSAEEKRVGVSGAPVRMDGRGHHYVEVIPDRSEWKRLRTNFGDMYVSPRRILEYDHAGRFVGVRCQVHRPHFMGPEGPKSYWDVDAEGNIYYLKWTNKGVEVWKSPVQKKASQPK
ncbi:hypothetical protein GBSOP10_10359 [Armatimonadetes bacterium GBS]|nr:hypothetical protein GBSOP10_10359 [Armatimonadetes bacterium GBS]CUU38854.1 hypothetical protein GXSOP10_14552 [Armatimonadetes bacterium GXS]